MDSLLAYGDDSDDGGPESPSLSDKISAAAGSADAATGGLTGAALGGSSAQEPHSASNESPNASPVPMSASGSSSILVESVLLGKTFPPAAPNNESFRRALRAELEAGRDITTTIMESSEFGNPEALQWVSVFAPVPY